jgi:hypothetical protein
MSLLLSKMARVLLASSEGRVIWVASKKSKDRH